MLDSKAWGERPGGGGAMMIALVFSATNFDERVSTDSQTADAYAGGTAVATGACCRQSRKARLAPPLPTVLPLKLCVHVWCDRRGLAAGLE